MPPKTPKETPSKDHDDANIFGHASELAARIEAEGPDVVYVEVWRTRDEQVDPELCAAVPGRTWSVDYMRDTFGAGRYVVAVYRTERRQYLLRRTITIAGAPRVTPTTPPPAAPPSIPQGMTVIGPNGAPVQMPGDPMSMMFFMLNQQAQTAQASAAEARKENSELLRAIVSRTQSDPLDQIGRLMPMIQRESTSTEVLKLADQLASRYKGEGRKADDDDADDDTSPLAMLGALLAPIVERFLAKGAAPAAAPNTPQAARRVPNTAQPASQPAPAPGAQPVPPTTPPPVTPDSDFPIDDADDDATCPEGYTYTPGQLDDIDAGETRALAMKQHPALGSVCAILKMRFSENTADVLHVAKEVAAWLNYWGEAAEDQVSAATTHQEWSDADANRQALEALVREIITNARAAAEGKPAPQLPIIAAVAIVHPDFVRDVAIELARMFVEPKQADPAPHPAPSPEPEPTPASAPTEPTKKRSRRAAK